MWILTVFSLRIKKEKEARVAPAGSVIRGEGKVIERRGNWEWKCLWQAGRAPYCGPTLTCDPPILAWFKRVLQPLKDASSRETQSKQETSPQPLNRTVSDEQIQTVHSSAEVQRLISHTGTAPHGSAAGLGCFRGKSLSQNRMTRESREYDPWETHLWYSWWICAVCVCWGGCVKTNKNKN